MTRRGHLISFRTAAAGDAAALAAIDAESWPEGLAPSVEQWRSRLNVFAEGQLVVEYDGHPAVVAAAQRIFVLFVKA